MRFFLSIFMLLALTANATNHYVDRNAMGSNTGTSWANAWTNFASVSISAGSTNWISGGTYQGPGPDGGGSAAIVIYGIAGTSNAPVVFTVPGGQSSEKWMTNSITATVTGDFYLGMTANANLYTHVGNVTGGTRYEDNTYYFYRQTAYTDRDLNFYLWTIQ